MVNANRKNIFFSAVKCFHQFLKYTHCQKPFFQINETVQKNSSLPKDRSKMFKIKECFFLDRKFFSFNSICRLKTYMVKDLVPIIILPIWARYLMSCEGSPQDKYKYSGVVILSSSLQCW